MIWFMSYRATSNLKDLRSGIQISKNVAGASKSPDSFKLRGFSRFNLSD